MSDKQDMWEAMKRHAQGNKVREALGVPLPPQYVKVRRPSDFLTAYTGTRAGA